MAKWLRNFENGVYTLGCLISKYVEYNITKMLAISKDYLVQKYEIERLPAVEISKMLNISQNTIKKYLDLYCIKTRTGCPYRYGFNESFFSVPNVINSYWAGFIAADGNIKLNNRGKSQKTLRIKLASKDFNHLQVFKTAINYTGDIKIRVEKRSEKSKLKIKDEFEYCVIEITSDIICSDLDINYNIIPNKTLILKPPTKLQDDHVIAFIIGYIDGDGSIPLRKNGRPRISIIGTKSMLEWIKENLLRILKLKSSCSVLERQGFTNKFYTYAIPGYKDILKLYDYIDNLNLYRMERKWQKVGYLKKSLTQSAI